MGEWDVMAEDREDGRTPRVERLGVPVARIVDRAHEQGIPAALAEWASCGLDNDGLESILVYCAEQRCTSDHATCPGCRLRTERQGVRTLDDFVARFAEVRFAKSASRLIGPGQGVYQVESLERLAATWPGVEHWFAAR